MSVTAKLEAKDLVTAKDQHAVLCCHMHVMGTCNGRLPVLLVPCCKTA